MSDVRVLRTRLGEKWVPVKRLIDAREGERGEVILRALAPTAACLGLESPDCLCVLIQAQAHKPALAADKGRGAADGHSSPVG
jgi:hypothetical protein